jgi:hypothetical protein
MIFIFLWMLVCFAQGEAEHDYSRILRRLPIHHGRRLVVRLISAGAIWAGVAWFRGLSHPLWHGLLLIPMGWAVWTMYFRFGLNFLRGLDVRYLSPSSWYDWQFLRLTYIGRLERGEWLDSWSVWSKTELARRAGVYAYAFEVAVLLASLAVLLWIAR